MRRRRKHQISTSRRSPLLPVVVVVASMILPLSTTQCIFVRSMLLTNVSQRYRVALPLLLHRSILPFRTLVTTSIRNDVATRRLLTRTMVRRMRLAELKDEVERRGLVFSDSKNAKKAKRSDLIDMILANLSTTPAEDVPEDVVSVVSGDSPNKTNGIHTDTTNITVGDGNNNDMNKNVITDAISVSLEQGYTSPEGKPGRSYVEQYPIRTIQLDPNTTYSIAAIASSALNLNNGNGIGIVLRDCSNNNATVWKAQKFYPGYHSMFEANYCAIILALKYALQFFMLRNIQIHVSTLIIHDQLVGKLPITKPSLLQLIGHIHQLLKEHETTNVQFQVADSEVRNEALSLAFDAHKTKESFNLGEEDDHRLAVDPMDAVLTNAKMHQIARDVKNMKPTKTKEDEILRLNGAKIAQLMKSDDASKFVLKHREFVIPQDVTINPSLVYTLRFDGGARGNPGPAGAGMVLYDDQNREIWQGVKYLGRSMSNNLAEYTALNTGLSHALSMGIERIRCEGDSELVIKQLNGVYQVKSDNLRDLFDQTRATMHRFKSCDLRHIRREFNKRADELANQAMTMKTDSGFERKCTE